MSLVSVLLNSVDLHADSLNFVKIKMFMDNNTQEALFVSIWIQTLGKKRKLFVCRDPSNPKNTSRLLWFLFCFQKLKNISSDWQVIL